MLKQIAKRLVGHEQVSWETMAGDLSICLALMFQAALWNSAVHSPLIALTGGMLILFGTMWVFLGNHPLFLENRPTSVTIGGWVIIASGCCIMGLGIGMIISLDADVSWMPRLAGIFYSLAIFVWVFVLLKGSAYNSLAPYWCCFLCPRERVRTHLQCASGDKCNRF